MDYVSFLVSGNGSPIDGYNDWASGWGVDIGGPDIDHEPDGISNLLEYALGGDPTSNDASSILPTWITGEDGGSKWLYYSYKRRTDATDRGLSYKVYSGDDLTTGLTDEVAPWNVSPPSGGFETATHRIPTDGAPKGFMQLEVELEE